MAIVFGKAFSLPLMLLADQEALAISTLVSARIYSMTPSAAQRDDSAGALADYVKLSTVLSTTGTNTYTVGFTALTDPEPNDTEAYEVYWLVASVKLETGGAVVPVIKPFIVWRLDAVNSVALITAAELKAIDKLIGSLRTDAQINAHVENAKTRVCRKLKGKGFRRGDIEEADIVGAAKSLALSYVWRDIGELTKSGLYKDEFEEVFALEPIGTDANGDGVVDPQESISSGVIWVGR